MRTSDLDVAAAKWWRSPLGAALAWLVGAAVCGAPVDSGAETLRSASRGDPGRQRFSTSRQITPANVAQLVPAWTHEHGLTPQPGVPYSYALTPIYADGHLYICTPYNHVIALDPATGAERWRFDPGVDRSVKRAMKANCRGVTLWRDRRVEAGAACATRIFSNSIDVRLFALDARTGEPCPGFGVGGVVEVGSTKPEAFPGEFSITSPPAVIGDVVVVGSAIADNGRGDAPRGTVRAFDARSGAPRWEFEPIPQSAKDPARRTWRNGSWARAGHANVWSVMTTDEARGLVFLPVSSASPDFYGGDRRGANLYSGSIVALNGETGEVAWSYQTVHHDLWDYDPAAAPLLTTLRIDGRDRDVVVVNTKQGYVFVLDRDTGEPVFPVSERPVPASDVAGEAAWPTQPVPSRPPPLVPQALLPEDAWGRTEADRAACRERLEGLRSEGIYTPPSLEGTVVFPGNIGGVNWGGGAVDPHSQTLVVATNRLAHVVTLMRDGSFNWFFEALRSRLWPVEGVLSGFGRVPGSAYGMVRQELRAPSGLPCNAPPWATLTAVDLARGSIRWEVPLGESHDIADSGAIGVGGPILTASRLAFIAAGTDQMFRAYALDDGSELFSYALPAGGQATPMTYVHRGKQYVVIAAGGNSWIQTELGDSLIAFALPDSEVPAADPSGDRQ